MSSSSFDFFIAFHFSFTIFVISFLSSIPWSLSRARSSSAKKDRAVLALTSFFGFAVACFATFTPVSFTASMIFCIASVSMLYSSPIF